MRMSRSTKRVSRPHKTRSKARAAPVGQPESSVEEPHSAGIAPEHEIAPAPRATPRSAAVLSGAPKRLHQIDPRKYSAVEARIFLLVAVGCSMSCHSDKAWEVNYKRQVGSAASQSHDNLVHSSVATPRGIGPCFGVGMGVSRSQDWRSIHLGPGRPR